MTSAKILNIDGSTAKQIDLPMAFSERVRPDLIARAAIAENTARLQPQGHYVLAGMQTTARYYGAMASYRTGRHMGIAIRPREKLGGGVQGKVKRIPSAVKGKRAHPHLIEKRIAEEINIKEYQKAIRSAIAATSHQQYLKFQLQSEPPIIVAASAESISKTKDVVKMLGSLKLDQYVENGKRMTKRKGIRRLSSQRRYKKSVLIVAEKGSGLIKAARNMAGVDACSVDELTANALAPGGRPGRLTIWSEKVLPGMDKQIEKLRPR